MSGALAVAQRLSSFAEDGEARVLERVSDEGCALAVWRRNLGRALEAALAGLEPDEIDDIDDTVPLADGMLQVAARLGAAGYPADAAVSLACDIAMLLDRHAGVRAWSAARLRLEWIETDACRRFHADVVTLRLLTTYLGPGTQWRYADEYSPIFQIGTGDVAIFKGRLLAPEPTILHRSPPVAGSGERRLLLAIDPIRAHDIGSM